MPGPTAVERDPGDEILKRAKYPRSGDVIRIDWVHRDGRFDGIVDRERSVTGFHVKGLSGKSRFTAPIGGVGGGVGGRRLTLDKPAIGRQARIGRVEAEVIIADANGSIVGDGDIGEERLPVERWNVQRGLVYADRADQLNPPSEDIENAMSGYWKLLNRLSSQTANRFPLARSTANEGLVGSWTICLVSGSITMVN